MSCEYSMAHYRTILEQAKERYWLPVVSEVGRALPKREFFLIRHDVDISPWAALETAKLEHSLGIRTSYYVRLHAPYYNPFEPGAYRALREIVDLGHEVGLHYEPGFYETIGRDAFEGIKGDIQVLDHLLGIRTASISQHEPSLTPMVDGLSAERPCAYQRHLIVDIKYFADSGHHWREGCICTKIGRFPQIHTLIHPHAWVFGPLPWREVLERHLAVAAARMSDEMKAYVALVEGYLASRPAIDADWVKRCYGDGQPSAETSPLNV